MIITESNGSAIFTVKVIPRALRDEIVGVEGDALKIRLRAPPVKGHANEALIHFLAERLGVPRAHFEIVRGAASRHKLVRIRGLSAETLCQRIGFIS